MEIKKVGVVGCGLMGRGIAEVSARSGYEVVVSEVNQELLDKGIAEIDRSLTRGVDRGKVSQEEKDATLGRIIGTVSLEDFKDCNIVIEAIVEKMDAKRDVFRALDGVCPQDTILTSNTSCLSITEMAMATKRPDKVVGLHFFNPAPVMKVAELVTTIVTSEETVNTVKAFGQSLGKTVVITQDQPGFIVNRLLVPFLFDAMRMYESGLATREDIDQGVVGGLNHPMGPLTLADLIGLDTLCLLGDAMYEELKDAKFSPPILLKKMVIAGQLGRKSGKGFYDY